ncbi:glycoside hydrolase [Terrimonas sp.]|uniref:glycoside hydrolase family 95 protein n=1 Tax=Terrimonas sp. TaxID=1914338 RepID=UPI000D50780F|nr:glycoside hydrolase family 95 protein [Terrimonas sp.]PVD50201.1 glycoside hydrolase [Terrimonas sp.]
MRGLIFLLLIASPPLSIAQKDLELWYTAPAQKWTDAMPVGNGRMGGMVFGRWNHERIQLNEESIWAGSKINNNNKQSATHLPEIQKALFEGDYKKAFELSSAYMVGTPPRVRSYEPLGNLFIDYAWKSEPEQYKRSLTLNTGIVNTTYSIGGKKVKQEVFVSAPQDIMVVKISSEAPADVNIAISREQDIDVYKSERDIAYYSGQINDTYDSLLGPGGKHMRFAAAMKIVATDGKVVPVQTDSSAGYHIKHAKKIVLIITGASNYNIKGLDTDNAINPLVVCKEKLSRAAAFKPDVLQQLHEKNHRSLFDRVAFNLGEDTNKNIPTNERLEKVKAGAQDNGLIALYYQFGRYLLMGSSRSPGVLPANLQGIWNDMYKAPWNADFHTNINLQMNYWPAESGNLPETVLPLANFMQQLIVPGGLTAKEMYNAHGWTLHHLTDVYGRTAVADGVWGVSPMAGPWMTFPLYRHYEFTGDSAYLRSVAYPVIKGSVEFVLDFLVKSPGGYLVTNPSHSPENAFFVPGTDRKEQSQLSYAATIDIEIINGLFNNFINAANILKTDTDLVNKVQAAQKMLPPLQVAANGTLQEWIKDCEEVEPGHRHISHLLGLYPLDLISPNTPALFTAAQKTIERRLANGGGHTGWSKAWIINFYARLLNGDEAGRQVQSLLQKSTLPGLLSTHPPFQIDGNFGGAAGIAEMLLQSQHNEIHVLPALPSNWSSGSVKGLRARDGYTVDIDWKNGTLIRLVIQSDRDAVCKVRYKEKLKAINLKKGNNNIIF